MSAIKKRRRVAGPLASERVEPLPTGTLPQGGLDRQNYHYYGRDGDTAAEGKWWHKDPVARCHMVIADRSSPNGQLSAKDHDDIAEALERAGAAVDGCHNYKELHADLLRRAKFYWFYAAYWATKSSIEREALGTARHATIDPKTTQETLDAATIVLAEMFCTRPAELLLNYDGAGILDDMPASLEEGAITGRHFLHTDTDGLLHDQACDVDLWCREVYAATVHNDRTRLDVARQKFSEAWCGEHGDTRFGRRPPKTHLDGLRAQPLADGALGNSDIIMDLVIRKRVYSILHTARVGLGNWGSDKKLILDRMVSSNARTANTARLDRPGDTNMGLMIASAPSESAGVPIMAVASGGQAESVGLRAGHSILSINGGDVRGFTQEEAGAALTAAENVELQCVSPEAMPSVLEQVTRPPDLSDVPILNAWALPQGE